MATFVSYARQDHEAVGALKDDLERLGRQVWIDEKLRGGQEWWDEILAAIRSCEVFVWTVSPTSVKSTACKAELDYAFALDRPVLPIMIKPVAIGITPERVAKAQIVDYTTRDRDQVIKLAGDLQAVHLPPPLPAPLPEPPPVPMTYLGEYSKKLTSRTPISAADQRAFLDFLRPIATSTEDPEEAHAAWDLLRQLRDRPEVSLEAATAIDSTPEPGLAKQWSTGVFVGLLLATVFLGGVVGIVAGSIGRATPAKRRQATIVMWVGVVMVFVYILSLLVALDAARQCDPAVEFCA